MCQPTVRKYLEGLITNKRKRGKGDEKDNCCDGDDYGACAGATGRCANGGFRPRLVRWRVAGALHVVELVCMARCVRRVLGRFGTLY